MCGAEAAKQLAVFSSGGDKICVLGGAGGGCLWQQQGRAVREGKIVCRGKTLQRR